MKKRTVSLVLAIVFFCAFLPNVMLSALAYNTFIRVLVDPIMDYTNVDPFSDGLAIVQNDGERGDLNSGIWGFIDKTGAIIIPLEYDAYGSVFSEGLAAVSKDGKYGYIDKTGNTVIPFIYDNAWSFSEGLAAVEKDGKYGYINKTGEVIIPFLYDIFSPFSEGLACVTNYDNERDAWTGYIDKTGIMVIPLKDMAGWAFSEGMAAVVGEGSKWGFINRAGALVIPLQYDSPGDFNEGLAGVEKDGKWGFIDKAGKVVISFEYQRVFAFSEGLAAVSRQDGNVYIDKSGEVAFPFTYNLAGPFSDGIARVSVAVLDEKGFLVDIVWNLIDKTGELLLPLENEYSKMWYSEGLAVVEANGKWGILEIVADPLSTANTWARDGITAALSKGFVPEDIQNNYTNVITRAEFCRMAVQWVEYATAKSIDTVLSEQGKSLDPNAFTDTHDPYILAAFTLGITSGVGNNLFNPSGQFNREQAATMIMNTCRAIGANVSNPPASGFTDMGGEQVGR